MFKLIAVTLAAFYVVLTVFGDESRRVDIDTTQAITDNVSLTTLASFAQTEEIEVARLGPDDLSEAEAVAMALEAGRAYRAERQTTPLRGAPVIAKASATTDAPAATEQSAADIWEVTGSRVNLRAGPGTGNAVVGQLSLGAEAEVLGEGDGWYQIRTVDGGTSGWIYGKFLAQKG